MKIYYKNIEIAQNGGVKIYRGSNCVEPEHKHEFVELSYILEGNVVHKINNSYYDMSAGDMIFVNFNQVHSFSTTENLDYINILFSMEFMRSELVNKENIFELFKLFAFDDIKEDISDYSPLIRFKGEDRERLESIIFFMFDEFTNKRIGYQSFIRDYLSIILMMMIRNMQDYVEKDDVLNGTLKYIERNCFSDILVNDLAKHEAYSPAYFSKKFKKTYGIGISEYIQRRRIEAAVNLLKNTDIKIDEISERVGYSDVAQFHRQFKKYTGYTPGTVRKKQLDIEVEKPHINL